MPAWKVGVIDPMPVDLWLGVTYPVIQYRARGVEVFQPKVGERKGVNRTILDD